MLRWLLSLFKKNPKFEQTVTVSIHSVPKEFTYKDGYALCYAGSAIAENDFAYICNMIDRVKTSKGPGGQFGYDVVLTRVDEVFPNTIIVTTDDPAIQEGAKEKIMQALFRHNNPEIHSDDIEFTNTRKLAVFFGGQGATILQHKHFEPLHTFEGASQILYKLSKDSDPNELGQWFKNNLVEEETLLRLYVLLKQLSSLDFPSARMFYFTIVQESELFKRCDATASTNINVSFLPLGTQADKLIAHIKANPADKILITGNDIYGHFNLKTEMRKQLIDQFVEEYHIYEGVQPPSIFNWLEATVVARQIQQEPSRKWFIIGPFYGSPWFPFSHYRSVSNMFEGLPEHSKISVYHLGGATYDELMTTYYLSGAYESDNSTHQYFISEYDSSLIEPEWVQFFQAETDEQRKAIIIESSKKGLERFVTYGSGIDYVADPFELIYHEAAVADIARGDYENALHYLQKIEQRVEIIASTALCYAFLNEGKKAENALEQIQSASPDLYNKSTNLVKSILDH